MRIRGFGLWLEIRRAYDCGPVERNDLVRLNTDTLEVLLERLTNAADEQFDFDIQIGASCFPLDAVSGDELIAAADRNRKASKLRSLPERVVGIGIDEASRLSPDVQG